MRRGRLGVFVRAGGVALLAALLAVNCTSGGGGGRGGGGGSSLNSSASGADASASASEAASCIGVSGTVGEEVCSPWSECSGLAKEEGSCEELGFTQSCPDHAGYLREGIDCTPLLIYCQTSVSCEDLSSGRAVTKGPDGIWRYDDDGSQVPNGIPVEHYGLPSQGVTGDAANGGGAGTGDPIGNGPTGIKPTVDAGTNPGVDPVDPVPERCENDLPAFCGPEDCDVSECLMQEVVRGTHCGDPNAADVVNTNICDFAIRVEICFERTDGTADGCGRSTIEPGQGNNGFWACGDITGAYWAIVLPDDRSGADCHIACLTGYNCN